MDLSGSLPIHVPPAEVARLIHDPLMLAALVPACRAVQETAPGHYTAQIEYAAGPVPIRFQALITVIPVQPGQTYEMQIKGGTLVTGVVTVANLITLHPTARGCRLEYAGTLSATGIARRMLLGREDALRTRTTRIFYRLKAEIEQAWRRNTA